MHIKIFNIVTRRVSKKKNNLLNYTTIFFLRKAITSTRVKNICSYTSPINIYFSQKKLS